MFSVDQVSQLAWPDVRAIDSESVLIEMRDALPKRDKRYSAVKWYISSRLRSLRLKRNPIPRELHLEMFREAGDTCPVCNTEMLYWRTRRHPTLDHIIPLCKGGTSERSNLRVICNRCNASKNGR